jgi:hypothetical protein
MSVALLMFNLGENAGIERNVQSLADFVDEIVIVDSSPLETYQALLRALEGYDSKVYRVLPMGFVDPLRPFGIAKVESEFAFILDADEEPSSRLKHDLRGLTDFDAYVVPRFEEGLRSFTYHLRLLRCALARYRGRSFDFPTVTGRTGWLDRKHHIVHHANYESFFEDKSRRERYFTIENIERPFTSRFLRRVLTVRLRNRSFALPLSNFGSKHVDSVLSSATIRWLIEIEFARDLLLGKGPRLAAFNRRYTLEKVRFLSRLPKEMQEHIVELSREIQRSGGLFEYLGLADSEYIELLSASFDWNLRGIDVYLNLLEYRHRVGRRPDFVPPNRGPNVTGND